MVCCKNTKGTKAEYGVPTEEGYYNKYIGAFKLLQNPCAANSTGNYEPRIYFDGANGVGAKKIKYFQEGLKGVLDIVMFNDGCIGKGQLNNKCGADHVKSEQQFPNGVPKDPNVRCVSVDGDADRVVYYYLDGDMKFHLLDGDRIATLLAGYLKELIEQTGLDLNMGLVQTAYANGASTDYIVNKMVSEKGLELNYDVYEGVFCCITESPSGLYGDRRKTPSS